MIESLLNVCMWSGINWFDVFPPKLNNYSCEFTIRISISISIPFVIHMSSIVINGLPTLNMNNGM